MKFHKATCSSRLLYFGIVGFYDISKKWKLVKYLHHAIILHVYIVRPPLVPNSGAFFFPCIFWGVLLITAAVVITECIGVVYLHGGSSK